MQEEGVACSRCGATFESQDDLIVHSIDTHSGVDDSRSSFEPRPNARGNSDGNGTGATTAASPGVETTTRSTEDTVLDEFDADTVERLTTALEERPAVGRTVGFDQRFIGVAGVAILAVALVLSYLQFTGVLDTTVFMFALGTLFGLTLSYLQIFLQTVRG